MRVYTDDMSLEEYDAWGGAEDIKEIILAAGKEDEFDQLIQELYPDGIEELKLNDLLWFESDWLFDALGMTGEEDDEDEEEDEEEEEEDGEPGDDQ